jgi:alpha-tubulin suppressor-like RCC1 family protein
LPAGKKAQQVQSSGYNTCVLTTDQQVYCAGQNSSGGGPGGGGASGALGVGDTVDHPTPVQFPLAEKIASFKNISTNVCAITISQKIYCAGANVSGQLGIGNTITQTTPVLWPLPAGKTAHEISGSFVDICVLTNDQLLYCSGQGYHGEFGNGTNTNQTTPTLYGLF